MDETPIKAGQAGPGKLKPGWFWPLYGDRDEVVFTFAASRGRQHIETVLRQDFRGTLLSDGYAAYARYAQQSEQVTHAQCWVHSRRQFIEAEAQEPAAVREALDAIAALYRIEDDIQAQRLTAEKKHAYRLAHSKPVVDAFFDWCERQLQRSDLTPSSPLTKALGYVLRRAHAQGHWQQPPVRLR